MSSAIVSSSVSSNSTSTAADALTHPFSYTRRLWANGLVLLGTDLIALTLALFAGGLLRMALFGDSMVPPWAWLIIPVWGLGASAMGLIPGWGIGPVEQLRRLVVLICAAFGFAAAALFLSKTGAEASRFTLTTSFLFSLLLVPLIRVRVKSWLVHHGRWGVPTVIYGSDDTAMHVLEALNHEAGMGYIPVGVFDDASPTGTMMGDVPVLGPLNQSTPAAACAMIVTAQLDRGRLVQLLEGPLAAYRRAVLIPDLLDAPSLWVTPRDFVGLVGLEVAVNLLNPVSRISKRFVDLVFVLAASPVWVPLCSLLAALSWLEDRHSPFFLQERVGHKQRRFKTWKFRTMHPDAEALLKKKLEENPELEAEWSSEFKLRNDPRITRVGAFLRKTSLDELPQLVNVLRGEMSLVGPRPLPEYHYDKLPAPLRALRDRVRPGMTGLWQVSGRSESGIQGMERWDAYYVRNWSVWLDVVILVRTLRAVYSGRGAY